MDKPEMMEMKAKLYSQIEQLNNETALQMLQEAVTAYSAPSNDILDDLSAAQKERLNDSLKQASEGNTTSDDEVKQKARQWLSK